MDTYQAVYDATRSKIGRVDSSAVEQAAREAFDISHAKAILQEQIASVGYEMMRPSVLYHPSIGLDGTKWCVLYGDDLMHGVSGFGVTPDEAMRAFDQAWWKEKTPAAVALSR